MWGKRHAFLSRVTLLCLAHDYEISYRMFELCKFVRDHKSRYLYWTESFFQGNCKNIQLIKAWNFGASENETSLFFLKWSEIYSSQMLNKNEHLQCLKVKLFYRDWNKSYNNVSKTSCWCSSRCFCHLTVRRILRTWRKPDCPAWWPHTCPISCANTGDRT